MGGQNVLSGGNVFTSKTTVFGNRDVGVLSSSRSLRGSAQPLFDGNWESPGRLTFSLAPDSTTISAYDSSLFKSFSHLLDSAQLEKTIGDAFQDWAAQTSINFGQVSDSGDFFGIAGLSQGDSRFGDIRIGAIPMDDSVLAVATPFELGISGTWSGDILFNANAKFKSVEQFYSVALHEIGHALGLPHTTNSNDVMNPRRYNSALSSNDIDALQQRYGNRALDQYDSGLDNNDSFDNATRIRLAGSLKGEVPLIAFGDIDNSNDTDFFEARLYSGYSGTVSFRLVTNGISQLAPSITVFDENENQLAFSASQSGNGDDLLLTVTPSAADDKLFIRVESAGVDSRQVGSYGLVTLFDSDVQYDPSVLNAVLRQDLWNLRQDDIHTIFTAPAPVFNDDLHTNDTRATATPLEPVAGALADNRFRVQAGLADSIDVDFYSLTAPDSGTVLTASLISLEQLGLVGEVQVFSDNRMIVQQRVIGNGNGRFLLQIDNIEPGSEYFVAVVANEPGQGFDIGNYTLDLTFQNEQYLLDEFASGTLSEKAPQQIHTLFVAETQLFDFGVEAHSKNRMANQNIWTTVYSEVGDIVHRAVTRPGEFRTTNSIILQPGTYSVRTTLAQPKGREINQSVKYSIFGKNHTDPMGPELLTPANQPFKKCDPLTNEFCYPGDRHTIDPFLIVIGNESMLPPGETTPPEFDNVNLWYWYQNWTDDQIG